VGALLHALRHTAVLGAIYLTGFLGGAIATHYRIGSPLFSHVLFGAYVAAIMWGGLLLRRPQLLRAVLPARDDIEVTAAADRARRAAHRRAG
jgi:hypothetical protein